jgi:hypothetical protein
MPKELHEITKFTSGTITVPDEKDIPEDAASYSLNIDSVTEGGKLKGVPSDLYLLSSGTFAASGGSATVDAQVMATINRDGYRDLVYFEDDSGKIHNIMDFYRTGYVGSTGIAAVEGGASLDTLTDSSSGWITNGFRAGQIIHVTGFTGTSANNTTYQVDSVAAGTLTLTADDDVTDDLAGELVYVNTWKQNDMGAARSADGWRTGVAGELGDSEEVSMQVHNKEVHVGMGKGSADAPKWVGYVDHEQFDTKTVTMQMEDAELKAPGSFPEIYSSVTVGDYAYGIQYGGTRIYRFSATAFDSASTTIFTSTQGLSLVHAGDDIWVYDDNANFGTIYKIDVSAWGTADEIIQSNAISGYASAGTAPSTGFEVSDLFDDGTVMWVALWSNTAGSSGLISADSHGNFLHNVTLVANNDAYILTNRTPSIDDDTGVIGEFLAQAEFYLYKQCLVDLADGTGIGMLGFLNTSGNAVVQTDTAEDGGGITIAKGLILWTVQRTYTARNAYRIGFGSLSGTTNCQIHEVINGGAATDFGGGAASRMDGGFHGDATRLFVTKWSSATSSAVYAFADIIQSGVSPGNDSSSAHDTPPGAAGSNTGIEADGLTIAVAADHDGTGDAGIVYLFEQDGGGGFITSTYNDSTVASETYRERSDLRIAINSAAQATGTFSSSNTYFWKFSFMYDEYQESPLSFSFSHNPTNSKNIKLTIDLYQASSISKRASHLMIYRSSATGATATTPDTFYRLVQNVPLANRFTLVSNGWGSSVDFRQLIFVDLEPNIGASYEARTLMPQTLESSSVNYALSTQINSMHIVGKCYKAEIPDAKNYLFKSKVNNFDQFDWTTDFLRLPTVPTALASFNGRIYAFDENNTYRINPQGFYVEDTFEGAGCSGAFAVVVTEYGMCYCDKNNIYLHDGKAPKPIATPILTGGTYSWHNVTEPDYGHKVMFDSKRKSFLIFFKGSDNYFYAWSYNLIHNRWDLLHFHNSQSPEGVLHGKNGELFVGVSGAYLSHYLGSTSTTLDLWEWQSKYMTMGEDTVKKMLYDVKVVGDATAPTVTYGVNGDTTPTTALSSGKVASGDKKSKSLQVKITQVAGATHKVDSVGVLYRRLPKTSGNI